MKKDLEEFKSLQVAMKTASFMIHAIHNIVPTLDMKELKEELVNFVSKVFKEDDLQASCVVFMLIDQHLTNRNYDESEKMFIELLRLAAKKHGKPDIKCYSRFITKKIEDAMEEGRREWEVLNEFLISSPYAKADTSDVQGVTHILRCWDERVIHEKEKKLLILDLEKIKVGIKNKLIVVKEEGGQTLND